MGKIVETKINRFDNGILEDVRENDSAGFAISKHFDILTFPHRLQPLRGMTTESTTDSKISNIILGGVSDRLYGVGTDPNNPTLGKLWVRSDNNTTANGSSFGASSTWRSLTTNQLSGAILRTGANGSDDAFLVDYPDSTGVRRIFWASTNLICSSDPEGASSANTQALTFSTISQGFVHPKDKILYFAYQDASTPKRNFIGTINASGTLTGAVIELPKSSRVYALTAYGNYLAIACTFPASGQGTYSSVVYLWDRDTSLTTFNESIPWGVGTLKVLNNVGGTLIGINTMSAGATGAVQDFDSIQIKAWNGGSDPTLIKEIPAINIVGSGTPSCTINPNVNFVYKNRLYYSVNITVNNATSGYYGLWSLGRNKFGRWVTTMERVATNANTETGVIAAAISGDFCAMAHTTAGTLTASTNGQTGSSTFAATSEYISRVLTMDDSAMLKKLLGVTISAVPLLSGQQIVLKYRKDADITSNASFTTIFTWTYNADPLKNTAHDAVNIESTGATLPHFGEIQFQILATGGAIPTSLYMKSEEIDNSPY